VPAAAYDYNYECGNSGGGFDKLRFKFPKTPPVKLSEDEIDTSIVAEQAQGWPARDQD